jgi:signal transduction histidine kinase/CheY-like chemotaxis protein/HPt (histidine-containing phosphotransfer) domain-containing protein
MEAMLELNHKFDNPLEEISAKVVEDSIRLTDSQIGYLAMVNEDETVLTMQYWSKSANDTCRIIAPPPTYQLEATGLWGEAVRQRKPIVTNNYANPSPYKRGLPEGHVPLVRHMNIPIFEGNRIVAVAGVGNKATDYEQRDVNQLQLLMDGWWRIVMHKRFEEQLIEARRQAEVANQAKSRFLAAMSHEIRTPMTAILGYADMLMDPTVTPSNRNNYSATIRRSGEHLLTLINDILDLSKIEAGKMTLDVGRCNVVSLLAEVASVVRPRAESHGVSFSIEYVGEIPETILTDGARLRQAIINLAGNAVKFTEKGSVRIVIALCEMEGDQPGLKIDVIDTGIGIHPEILPQLFQPFYQGDAAVSKKFGGTGLGLVISHHLATMLGGQLIAQSTLQQGSTFTLIVPTGSLEGIHLLQSPAEVEHEPSGHSWPAANPQLRGLKILLAEDGFDNRELIQAILIRSGAKVTTAENGRQAVDKATAEPFGVILMDMNMPEMDGYEATSVLRDRGYTGPIFALTANAMSEDRERCHLAGCDEYLTKPIDRVHLIQTIARFAGRDSASESAKPQIAAKIPDDSQTIISEYIDDPEMTEIIRGFVGRLDGHKNDMRHAFDDKNFDDLRQAAHKLKGAGGSYGYPRLTEACRELEDAAKAGDELQAKEKMDTVIVLIHAIENGFLDAASTGTPS